MNKLAMLKNLSHTKKDELTIKLWEEIQQLKKELETLKTSGTCAPKKTSSNSSNPPSKDQKNLLAQNLEKLVKLLIKVVN